MIIVTATFSATLPADQVTSRNYFWTVNGTASLPVVGNPSDVSATLSCNPGDLIAFDLSDTNVVGTSALSNVLTGTAPLAPPTAAPTTPVANTLTFATQQTRKV